MDHRRDRPAAPGLLQRFAHGELEHGAVIVQLFGHDAHFLAEELANFVGDQAVVHANRAGLGATSAQVASLGEFRQTRDGRPVELDFAVAPRLQRSAVRFDVLLVESTKNLGTIGRPIDRMLLDRSNR